uniref:SEA domain-containing protein n=1 Tax=Steinernema glaseri TaxID=37863 RepID=A0A1I7ZW87_9BILA
CDNPSFPLRTSKSINNNSWAILKEYAKAVKDNNEEEQSMLREMMSLETEAKFLSEDQENTYWNMKLEKNRTDYISRRHSMSQIRTVINRFLYARTTDLERIKFDFISTGSLPGKDNLMKTNLKHFDLEEAKKQEDILSFTALEQAFPELEKWAVDLYVEQLKNNTLGIHPTRLNFLAGLEGHSQLLSMYSEIFTYGDVNETYLEPIPMKEATTYYAEYVVIGVVAFVVVVVIIYSVYIVLAKEKKYRVADQQAVIFNKMSFEDEAKGDSSSILPV